MMTKDEAKHIIRIYWLSRARPDQIDALSAMEFYQDIKKNRPDLLEFERADCEDPYQIVKAFMWEYLQRLQEPPKK
jgi:hypothetical protein